MEPYTEQNKRAWEYNAYEFWCSRETPEARAKAALADPLGQLKKYARYFDAFSGVKIANICGSCGKKAIPLAVLGADVTVFDFSEGNKRYALETAACANVHIGYEVTDVLDIDLAAFGGAFDVVFMEGGVLHYFHELGRFTDQMAALLRPGGTLMLSDFHPFTKITDALALGQATPGYFFDGVIDGEMAHARFFPAEVRNKMPRCSYRKYTLSEILNAVIGSGFTLERFDEHPAWDDPALPGEFTLLAKK